MADPIATRITAVFARATVCRTWILAVLAVSGIGVLAGCSPKRYAPSPPDLPGAAEIPKEVVIDVMFDATLSMQGFTRTSDGQATYYQRLMQEIRIAGNSGWSKSQVTLSKFGSEIKALASGTDSDIGAATRSDFYSDARYNKKTYIERVIAQADPGHLTVIVTDLFQNNADVSLLTQALKQKYFEQALSVGVVGFRSQFTGTVYDVGIDAREFPYQSGVPAETLRPFYLLVLGTHANVRQYISTLLASQELARFPAKQALIFSKLLEDKPVPFSAAELVGGDRISPTDVSNYVQAGNSGQRAKAFKINSGHPNAGFKSQWDYRPLAWTVPHSNDLTSEVTAWLATDTGKPLLELKPSSEAQRAFRVTATLIPQPKIPGAFRINLDAAVDVAKLPVHGLYRYRVVIRPARNTLPQWVSEWNLPEESLAGLPSGAKGFNGSRTYGLEAFLSGLDGAAHSVASREIADVYCYIKVE